MRSDSVVVTAPALDDDLGLAKGVEDLAIEQFVPEPGIEALEITILPRAAGSDIGGLGSDRRDPLLDGLGDELRAVVGANVARHATQDEQVREHVDDADGLELASDPDGQALVDELVNDVEHAEPPSVVRPVLDEVADRYQCNVTTAWERGRSPSSATMFLGSRTKVAATVARSR